MTIRDAKAIRDARTGLFTAGVSRRNFLKTIGIGGALAVMTEHDLAWAQALEEPDTGDMRPPVVPNDAVLLNANENPMGPTRAARQAIADMAAKGGRYDLDGETARLIEVFCEQNKLKTDYVSVYAGSSEPLHFAALAFCSPARGYVCADPTYEAGARAAKLVDAPAKLVRLKEDYSHDVKAMSTADPKAGLIYVCNPNNPTGTVTNYKDIAWLLDNKPKGSVVVVDEAYIHLSEAQSVIDKVAQDKDLIVLRTFSKIYGMAGIRCGLAIGRPDLLAKLAAYGINAMPITASAAARVSLLDDGLVPRRRRAIGAIRQNIFEWMQKNHYSYIPSETNCFMVDVKRPGEDVVLALQQKKIYIGRVWPVWPTYVRVTVGTASDMQSFMNAFHAVMQSKAKTKAELVDQMAHVPFSRLG
jgi:histidinol-phosphate aminotransferase